MSPRRNHRPKTSRRSAVPPRSHNEALSGALAWAREHGSATVSLRVAEASAIQQALDAQVQRIAELETALERVGHVGRLAANDEPGVVAITIRQGKRQAYTDAMFLSVTGPGADEARRLTEDYVEDVIGVLTEERV